MASLFFRPAHNVSFSDNAGPAEDTHVGSSTSSSPQKGRDALVPSSSSPARGEVIPLAALKTIPPYRRGVIFSPRLDTKYFHTDDLILPSPNAQKTPIAHSTVRSHSDPITPHDSPSRGKGRTYSSPPTLVRSILKSRIAQQIRLAASVEEGTLNNKEAARLLVSGKRPKLLARDSFQLALIRSAAGEGSDRKGKGKMADQTVIPGSDDSTASSSSAVGGPGTSDGAEPADDVNSEEEEEEEVEEDGALATGSLINIILDGAEDLLTLEEAYNTLTLRLRQRIPTEFDSAEPLSPGMQDDIRLCTQPLRDEAPAMVRAVQRDLQRLLGKLPHPSTAFGSSDGDSPFRDLMPIRDQTPGNARGRFTPSPTPGAARSSSPTRSGRQGYTESEVRYRREASGVGAAVLRFIAFTFHTPYLFSCFSEADLTSILEQVMIIPRTPKLPTPNPKRTYYLSIVVLGQMNLPSACVQPAKDKVVRALEGAMADNLGAMGGAVSGKEGPSATKKEGYSATTNVVSNYPSIFFPLYADLLSGCLRGMASSSNLIRYRAGAATCAFARAKFALLANTQTALLNDGDPASHEAWSKAKSAIQKSEYFVLSHLRSALKVPGRSLPIYGKDGEKKTEWHALEQIFKDTVGSTTDVHWACAAWSVLVTLMGSAYSSSGLAPSFDHIIDRSLQPSTNTVRPLLARTAWNHAIHAYLSAGYASSVAPEGHLIRSYKPFAASAQQTAEQRTSTVQLALDLALSRATDKASYARALVLAKPGVEAHYIWQRSEKAKKLQWLVTCGLGATAVIYAYAGMAVCHEDQPAKEMTAISGLPSSDGVPIPDMTPEESRLPRLDNAWEKVIHPVLQSSFAIRGVDRLTVEGWAIFNALTVPTTAVQKDWSLDRLVVPRYMTGEIFAKDKDMDLTDLMEDIQAAELQPAEIPTYGPFWVAKRLGRLLALFDDSLTSIYGLNDSSSVEWITDANGTLLIPKPLSNVWSNLLNALKSVQIARAPPTPLYLAGLQAVAKQLLHTFNRDPKTYVPISQIDSNGACRINEDELRIGITAHLFDAALEILGEEVLGTVRLRFDQVPGQTSAEGQESKSNIAQLAFGADVNGQPTVAGFVLGHLVRGKTPSLPLQPAVQAAFKGLVSKVLDAAAAPGYAGKLLGDVTNAMPFLFENCEETQLDIWRLVATKWTEVIDLQPSSTASSTNHTGALLVSLLSGPFRGRQVTSYWHRHADQADLAIWQALLKVTVLRFRAKRVGSNFGVLEALAGHLTDFLSEGEKTSSTTITLSCLASATSWISFVPNDQLHSSHWQIDDNFVPTDFLHLVNDALLEAYPSSETQDSTETDFDTSVAVSPAVLDVLDAMKTVVENTPGAFYFQILDPISPALSKWMEDPEKIGNGQLGDKLDELYVAVISQLAASFPHYHTKADSAALNDFAELYAPRLSRAQSSAVPLAFKAFWETTFARSSNLTYSDDVAGFLRDLLVAVPDMIMAPGLDGHSGLTEEESLARYPHIESTRPGASAAAEPEVEREHEHEMDIDILPTSTAFEPPTMAEYDADVSQSLEQTQKESEILVDETKDHISPPSSPRTSEAGSERYVFDEASLTDAASLFAIDQDEDQVQGQEEQQGQDQNLSEAPVSEPEQEPEADVFGPASLTQAPKAKATRIAKRKGGRTAKGKGKGKRMVAANEPAARPSSALRSKKARAALAEAEQSMASISAESSDIDDFVEDCIVVRPSPKSGRRGRLYLPPDVIELSREGEEDNEEDEISLTATPEPKVLEAQVVSPTTKEGQPRSSILTSAGRWLSRVPSFPFFSPSSNADVPPPATQQDPISKSSSELAKETNPPAPVPTVAHVQPTPPNRRKGRRRNVSNSASAAALRGGEPALEKVIEPVRALETVANASTLVAASTSAPAADSPVGGIQLTRSTSSFSNRVKRKASAAVEQVVPEVVVASDEPRRSKRRRTKNADVDIVVDVTDEAVIEPEHVEMATLVDQPGQTPVPGPLVDDEEDDELLLSPESARRRKREEEKEIQASQSKLGVVPATQWSESISGRFDDAPGDSSIVQSLSRRPSLNRYPSSPTSSAVAKGRSRSAKGKGKARGRSSDSQSRSRSSSESHVKNDALEHELDPAHTTVVNNTTTSPAKRSTQQTRVLQMLDEAARAKKVIDNMDYQGVKALLKNLNELREAAEGRMMSRLEELRGKAI